MQMLDQNFKYEPYNKWDASMAYIWRVIPLIYLPYDYFQENRRLRLRASLKPYPHPVYSYVQYEYENDFGEELADHDPQRNHQQ